MKKTTERLKAIAALSDQGALAQALSDPSHLVVEAAAKRIEHPRCAAALLQAYGRLHAGAPSADPGCWAREAVLAALARLGAPEAEEAARLGIRTVQVERVSNGLVDTATGLRAAAASALANLSARGALIDLAVLLNDFEPNVPASPRERPYSKAATRAAAAKAIGALGAPDGSAVLAVKLAFAGEELPEVLGECMDALAELQEPRTVELLAPWLDSLDPYLVTVAGTAMARAGGEAAVPLLVAALETAVSEAREPLVYAIASIRAEGARAALHRLTDHGDPVVQQAAQSML